MSVPVAKASRWMGALEAFVKDLRISSKEEVSEDPRGTPLVLWRSQQRFIENVGAGLDAGIRKFYNLKSRQLGITTISLAVDVLWLAVHPNMIGALVTDTDGNKAANRALIRKYINSFPEGYFGDEFQIVKDNRDAFEFSNGSVLRFLVAGTKKKSIAWAEGTGYAFAHLTEVSKYGDPEALASFEESLAQQNPNRLFIYESTANGFNHWRDKYLEARADIFTSRAWFTGWWAGDTNIIPRNDPRFEVYGRYSPSGEERELVGSVALLYGHKITPEQLAWIRWKEATASSKETDILQQNQPWTEDQAFVQSGYSFFQTRVLGQDIKKILDGGEDYGYLSYAYELGNDFFDVKLRPIEDEAESDQIELKVWEEPIDDALYAIGCDPAYGRNDHKDRHAIEVWRCFADKMVQVAEYATASVETKHCAWVLAHLAGVYKNCIVNVEIGGPGRMIMQEWEHLRQIMTAEVYAPRVKALEWEDVLSNARWYLYHRPDSPGAGYAANFECLALDTPLPSPTGWTTMGEVKEGDYLLSDTGEPTRVIGASDIKLNARCYEITFDDDTRIIADENHWWKVARRHWIGGADKLRQTKQLEAGKFYIRQTAPLRLPERDDLPVDPYLLGAWLGDGSSDAAVVTSGDLDVEEMCANIEACGQPTRRTWARTAWQIRLNEGNNGSRGNPLLHKLRSLGVLKNKHIPTAYLRGSFEQRLALLQGLMDTDGGAGGNGGKQCNFVTTNPAIAAGFSELVRSLGFKAKYLTWDESPAKGVQCALRYQFWFTGQPDMPVFRLRRKQDKIDQSPCKSNRQCHRIVSVREVDSVPVRCVMVDSPTKMYLAGDGMIPTHNTTWRTKAEIMHQFRGAYVTNQLEIRSVSLLNEMRIVVQDGNEIGAPESRAENSKDDRVFGTALAVRAWINWRQPELLAQGLTYERVMQDERGETTPVQRNMNDMVFRFFKTAQEKAEAQPSKPKWMTDRGL